METEVIAVGPELALDWLTGNTHNRPVRKSKVKELKKAILSGEWRLTHQGVAFTDKGPRRVLVDGQHRLLAIAELGDDGWKGEVLLQVTWGVPLDYQASIDCGAARTVVDMLIVDGKPAQTVHKGIANAMNYGHKAMSRAEQFDYIRRHWKVIDWAYKVLHEHEWVRGVSGSPLGAAIARAASWSPERRHQVKEFVAHVVTGQARTPQSEVRSALAVNLRRWLREQETMENRGASSSEKYWKCIRTLDAWLANRPEARITRAEDMQPFPLPGERRAA